MSFMIMRRYTRNEHDTELGQPVEKSAEVLTACQLLVQLQMHLKKKSYNDDAWLIGRIRNVLDDNSVENSRVLVMGDFAARHNADTFRDVVVVGSLFYHWNVLVEKTPSFMGGDGDPHFIREIPGWVEVRTRSLDRVITQLVDLSGTDEWNDAKRASTSDIMPPFMDHIIDAIRPTFEKTPIAYDAVARTMTGGKYITLDFSPVNVNVLFERFCH